MNDQIKLKQTILLDELSDEMKALRRDFDKQANWFAGQCDQAERQDRDATTMMNRISSLQQQLLSSRQDYSLIEQHNTSLQDELFSLREQNRNLQRQFQNNRQLYNQ
jgi:chromosome segregation ATPase